jgi:hypothetical protein
MELDKNVDLSDERVCHLELALEPGDGEEGPARHVLEQIQLTHLEQRFFTKT